MTMGRKVKVSLVALLTVFTLLMFATNYLSTTQLGRKIGLFTNNSASSWFDRGNLTEIGITPPGFAFSVWGLIYLWFTAALAYCWSLLFRRHKPTGEYLCCVPGLLPVGYLLGLIVSCVFNATWIILADRVNDDKYLLPPLTICLFGIFLSLAGGLAASCASLYEHGHSLREKGLTVDYWVVVGVVQNGIGLYAGWTAVASFLNVDIAVANLGSMDVNSADLLSLAHVAVLIATFACLDLISFDCCLRFVFTPYLTPLWALSTSAAHNYVAGSGRSTVTIEMVILLVALLALKVGLCIYRQATRPMPQADRPDSEASYSPSASPAKREGGRFDTLRRHLL